MNNDSFEKAKFEAFTKSFELSNIMVVAPTIIKFADRYSIDSFISSYDSSNPPKCVAFWYERPEKRQKS